MKAPLAALVKLAGLAGLCLGGAYVVGELVETIMGYKDPTYVIFDGDKDKWAYAYMLGWKKNENVEFDFRDAHDLTPMTGRAQDEAYVKSQLRERMKKSKQAIVLVGESTKDLRKFVPWEIDLAMEQNLPIIVVNLNGKRKMDPERCPVALRNHCAVHVEFKMKIIKHALDDFAGAYRGFNTDERAKGWRYYQDSVYQSLDL